MVGILLRASMPVGRHLPLHASPQSIAWEPAPAVSGQAPCERSGHSFTSCGGRFLLFGGNGRLDGRRAHPQQDASRPMR